MSLWTPGGERPVGRPDEPKPSQAEPADREAGPAGFGEADELSPDDRARAEAVAEEMAAVRKQLAEAPAAAVVANHAMGLYELAAIHLQQEPPNLGEAQLAIDAYAALIDAIGDRIGPDAATLRDALAQLRMAYVQIAGSAGSTPPPEPPAGTDESPNGG